MEGEIFFPPSRERKSSLFAFFLGISQRRFFSFEVLAVPPCFRRRKLLILSFFLFRLR